MAEKLYAGSIGAYQQNTRKASLIKLLNFIYLFLSSKLPKLAAYMCPYGGHTHISEPIKSKFNVNFAQSLRFIDAECVVGHCLACCKRMSIYATYCVILPRKRRNVRRCNATQRTASGVLANI